MDKRDPRYPCKCRISLRGEVAERLKAAVLKTVRAKALGGSNPSLSAAESLSSDPSRGEVAEWLKALPC